MLVLTLGGLFLMASCSEKKATTQVQNDVMSPDSVRLYLQDSIRRLDILVLKYPKNAELYHQRAKVRFQLGDTLSAYQDAHKSVALDEREPEFHFFLGMIHLAQNREDSALYEINTAANFGSSNPDVFLQLGNLLITRKENVNAMAFLKKAVQLGNRPADYFAYAYAQREIGKPKAAVETLLAGLNRDSTHQKSMALLFDLYLEDLHDEERALAINLKMLAADSLNPIARFQSGYFFYKEFDSLRTSKPAEAQKALQRSIAEYTKALKRNPTFARAWYQRGYSWMEAGQTERAIDDFDRALNYHPKYAEAEFMLGAAYEVSNEYDEAREHYQKALELKPDWTDAQKALRELPTAP